MEVTFLDSFLSFAFRVSGLIAGLFRFTRYEPLSLLEITRLPVLWVYIVFPWIPNRYPPLVIPVAAFAMVHREAETFIANEL